MSGFFKSNGTDSIRKKRERKSTAKVIAMREMAGLRKAIQKKRNGNSSSGKYKTPYYVRYHERKKDGVLIKTFRCAKCAGFVGADRKECGRCIAKLEHEKIKKSMGLDSSVDMIKIFQQEKKIKLDTSGSQIKSVKPKISKKAPKDGVKVKKDGGKTKKVGVKSKKVGVKNKKAVGFKTNMLKKITTKAFKSSKLPTELKSIQKKASIISSPKKVGSAKSQEPKMPKLKLVKQQKFVEDFELDMPDEIKPKLSKVTQLQISTNKTQSSVPSTPTVIKQAQHVKNIASASQIVLKRKTDSDSITERKSTTPKSGIKEDIRKNTLVKSKILSKRQVDSRCDLERKPSTSASGLKKCKTENLGIKLEKPYAIHGSKVESNKSTKTGKKLQVTGRTYASPTDPITSLKTIEIPTVITDTQKPANKNTKVFNPTMKMYEKERNIEPNKAAHSDMMTQRNIDKENFPESKDLFFGYLNLEQNTSRHHDEVLSLPTKSTDKEYVGIPEILLDSNIIGKECFSGLLNSPNIEIIEEKDKN